jgi:hypothetical protein
MEVYIGLTSMPFNSRINSQKNAFASHVALPGSGGRGRSDFTSQQGRKRLNVFLMASNSLVVVVVMIMMNCGSYVHMNIEPESILHVQTYFSFLKRR